jgi:hypothetical protein
MPLNTLKSALSLDIGITEIYFTNLYMYLINKYIPTEIFMDYLHIDICIKNIFICDIFDATFSAKIAIYNIDPRVSGTGCRPRPTWGRKSWAAARASSHSSRFRARPRWRWLSVRTVGSPGTYNHYIFSLTFGDFRWFLSIFVNFRQFSLIFINFRWLYVDFLKFLSIFFDFRRLSPIFGQKCLLLENQSSVLVIIAVNFFAQGLM